MPETAPAHDLIRHLTHELRQPLSAMESIAFYLQMTLPSGNSEVNAQVERLQQQVDNANWILTDCLHRLQLAPANPEPVDIPELINEVLAEPWPSDGLDAYADFAEDLPPATVDPEQFRHVLRAVLQFFRQSMETSHEVEFAGDVLGNRWRLEIRGDASAVALEGVPASLASTVRILESNAGTFSADRDTRNWLRLTLTLPK